jgi:hypothetical protein
MRPRLWMKPGMIPILHCPYNMRSAGVHLWFENTHTGAIIPGQLGPTSRVLFCVLSMSVILTMSSYVLIHWISEAGQYNSTVLWNSLCDAAILSALSLITSEIPEYLPDNERHFCSNCFLDTRSCDWWTKARDSQLTEFPDYSMSQTYGTKIADASAPVSLIASATVAKTGLSRCLVPAFFGFVPPTTFVPSCA